MNLASRIPKFPTITLAAFLAVFLMAGNAFAIDQPPQEPQQQRAWLVGHLVTDMEALGTFDGNALARVPAIVNALTDDQVALLAQYYYLTRSKTEQDAYLYALQQQGYTEEQVNAAKAQIADLLTVMNDQTVTCYDQFASMPEPVQYLGQVCYASVPGWCCNARCYVPDWYYDNGCYVGPCYNAAYAGAWSVPIYSAYYNHGSHFYTTYHNVANTVHSNRSTRMANRDANRLRNQGNWTNTLAHDRLLNRASTRFAANRPNHVANRRSAVRNAHAFVNHAGTNRARTGNRKAGVHNQASKSHANRASAVHPAKVQRQAAKAHMNHAAARHPAQIHRQAAKAHARHASASHARASRSTAHASHPRSAAHARAHASSGGHSKHR